MDEILFQEPTDLIKFHQRGMISSSEWWYLRKLEYLSQAWWAGTFSKPKFEKTDLVSRCSLCGIFASPGSLLTTRFKFDEKVNVARLHPECLTIIQKHKVKTWIKKN